MHTTFFQKILISTCVFASMNILCPPKPKKYTTASVSAARGPVSKGDSEQTMAKKHLLNHYRKYLDRLVISAEVYAFNDKDLVSIVLDTHKRIKDTANSFKSHKRLQSLADRFRRGIGIACYENKDKDSEESVSRENKAKNFIESFDIFINHDDCVEPLQGFNILFYYHGYMYVKTGKKLPPLPEAKPPYTHKEKTNKALNRFNTLLKQAESGELLPKKGTFPASAPSSSSAPRRGLEIEEIYASIALGMPAAAPTTAAAPQPTAHDTRKKSESGSAGPEST